MTRPFQFRRFSLASRLPVRAGHCSVSEELKKSSTFAGFALPSPDKFVKINSPRHEQRCSFAAAIQALRTQSPRQIAACSAA